MIYINDTEYQQSLFEPNAPLKEAFELYVTPTIIFFGIFGNLLASMTLSCTNIKRLPASHSMLALAVVDNGALLTILLSTWLPKQNIDIYNRYGWCQLIVLFNFVSMFLSPWYLVCLLIERYFDLIHPSSQWRIKTTFRARLVTIGIAILAIVFYLHIAWMFGVSSHTKDTLICNLWPENMNSYRNLNIADTILVVFIPNILFIMLLFRLVLYMWYDCQTQRSLRCLQPNLRQNANTTTMDSNFKANSVKNSSNNECIYPPDPTINVTMMVIIITFATILLSLMNNISRVMLTFGSDKLMNLQLYSNIVNYATYACKFYIYFAVSSSFRRYLRESIQQIFEWIKVRCCQLQSATRDISLRNIAKNEPRTCTADTQT